MNTYKLTLIAMLASLAIAGRMALAHFPNIQPVTAIIIIAGFWLGPSAGILIALLTTFVSNVLLGMGIWTIWQIIAWSIIGIIAGLLGKYWSKMPFWGLSIYGFISGLFFGVILSLTMRAAGQPFWAYYLAGLPMDINHAVSNTVFILALSPILGTLFQRYEKRNAISKVS
ncbi:ECF transporter S component [Halobacillus sp. SY10]|uniref:Energy-coupling factor transport system substrate-specific component n=2 Tax=Halobacillus TaxID=45667 RepID=A0A1H0STJ5_HALAD|nr:MULTISPECIES: ECF transporter S component [Halobacillus]RDY70132.1 ECF transporter S component [Halobacillus trueperi]SDP45082.1 energy-coupling factor transport system substrate-specific component [Halobacillus aidingensis]